METTAIVSFLKICYTQKHYYLLYCYSIILYDLTMVQIPRPFFYIVNMSQLIPTFNNYLEQVKKKKISILQLKEKKHKNIKTQKTKALLDYRLPIC